MIAMPSIPSIKELHRHGLWILLILCTGEDRHSTSQLAQVQVQAEIRQLSLIGDQQAERY